MVNPLFSIGGLASGLDTASIIDQLMSLERQPVRRYQQSQADLRSVDAAWSRIVGKLSGMRTAVDDVRKVGSFSNLTSASSSNENAVEVTSTGGGEVGSLSFTVEALAERHRVSLDGTFSSPTALVGAGSLTLTDETGGPLGSITTDGTTTLTDLADAIDALDVGIDARVLKVSDTEYQLLLSATSTGADGQFTATTDVASLGTASVASTGADAHLTMGGLDIFRSSNTINDLVEGASLTLRATTTADVTVNVDRDVDAAVENVKALVDAANSVLEQLKTDTAYDAETGKAGILQGDSLARTLAFDIRAQFTQVVGTGDITYGGQLGIALTRDGTISLDESALREALESDPASVEGFFSASVTGDSGVSATYVSSDATDGPITMTVSQAASVASATGATFTPPAGSPKVFTVTTPEGDSVSITIDEGMSAAQAVARINSALVAAGSSSLRASVGDDGAGGEALEFSTLGYGSAAQFTISGYGLDLDGTYSGTDVIADFGAGAVTGSGRSIQGDGDATGLTLNVTGGTGVYDLQFGSGLGGILDRFLDSVEGADGRIQVQRDSISGRISDFDEQIEAFEQRLTLREQALRAKFSGLESAMGRLQSQGQWLAGAIGGLPSTGS